MLYVAVIWEPKALSIINGSNIVTNSIKTLKTTHTKKKKKIFKKKEKETQTSRKDGEIREKTWATGSLPVTNL